MLRQSPLIHKRPAEKAKLSINSKHHTCPEFHPRGTVGRSSFSPLSPPACSPPLTQIFSTTSQGPTVSEIAHPYPQLLLLSSWRKWAVFHLTVPAAAAEVQDPYVTGFMQLQEETSPTRDLMSICRGTQHFSCVPCRSKQCPGLWRREAKLQILDPGIGISLSTSYRAFKT